jgi:tRNA A37 threonylcarbamoyltransferase TsaD
MQTTGKSINILGIETSCDETAAAVVTDGRVVKSNCTKDTVALSPNSPPAHISKKYIPL